MSVAVGGEDDAAYPPPELAEGSPPIPQDARLPNRGDRVFVDTSTILTEDWRRPLLLLAGTNLLEVCWSPYVAAEVARVATREQALETLSRRGTNVGLHLKADLETRRHEIDRVIADHERRWRSPDAAQLAAVYQAHRALPIDDPADEPVLAAAIAVNAAYLLTANTKHFAHGSSYAGVTFWHPDAFLTAYFRSDPDAYEFVRDEYAQFASMWGAKLRP